MLKQIIEETIKELLIGETRSVTTHKPITSIDEIFVGKKVMVRTYSAGVHFGELVQKSGQQVILKDSRRVFYWSKACSLSQLAMEGSGDIKSCKIAMTLPELLLDRVIEVIPMSETSIKCLYEASTWKK